MPDSCEEKVCTTKKISAGEVVANVPLSELDEMDPGDLMVVKSVLTYSFFLKRIRNVPCNN